MEEAKSNAQFLSILEAPLTKLQGASLGDIPAQLPKLIDLIRIIWNNSPYYNTPQRLTHMFQKVLKPAVIVADPSARCQTLSWHAAVTPSHWMISLMVT